MIPEGELGKRHEKVFSPHEATSVARMLGFPKFPIVVRPYIGRGEIGNDRQVVFIESELFGVIEEWLKKSPVHAVGLREWPEKVT